MVSEILRLTSDERREPDRTARSSRRRAGERSSPQSEPRAPGRRLVYARHAEEVGCDAVMAAPPLVTKPPPRP